MCFGQWSITGVKIVCFLTQTVWLTFLSVRLTCLYSVGWIFERLAHVIYTRYNSNTGSFNYQVHFKSVPKSACFLTKRLNMTLSLTLLQLTLSCVQYSVRVEWLFERLSLVNYGTRDFILVPKMLLTSSSTVWQFRKQCAVDISEHFKNWSGAHCK